jgi:hypothetical protein
MRRDDLLDKFAQIIESEQFKEMTANGKLANVPSAQTFEATVNAMVDSAKSASHEQRMQEMEDMEDVLNWLKEDIAIKMERVTQPEHFEFFGVLDYNSIGELVLETKANKKGEQTSGKNREALERQARGVQANLIATTYPVAPEILTALQTMANLDVRGMSARQLREFMNVVDAIIINEDLSGFSKFEVLAKAQEKVSSWKQFLKDTGMVVRQGVKRGTLRQGIHDIKEGFASTEQAIWKIGDNAEKLVVKIYNTLGYGDLKTGYVKTLQFMEKEVADKLNVLFSKGLQQDAASNIRLTMFSILNQTKSDDKVENEAMFNQRLRNIKDDFKLKLTSESNREEGVMIQAQFMLLRDAILDKTGIDITADVVIGLDNAVFEQIEWLTPEQQQAYSVYREAYDKLKPEFRELTERLFNQEFEEWNNYMVDSYRLLDGGLISEELDGDNFGKPSLAPNQLNGAASGSFNKRVKGDTINEKLGENNRVLNYNWFISQYRNTQEMAFDTNTLEQRMETYEIINSPDFFRSVGEEKHKIATAAFVKELRNMTGAKQMGAKEQEIYRKFSKVTGFMADIAAKRQLFSFSAWAKQYTSAWINVATMLGDKAGYMWKASKISGKAKEHATRLLNQHEIALRGETRAGTNIYRDKNLDDIDNRMRAAGVDGFFSAVLNRGVDKWKGVDQKTGKSTKRMGVFLSKGDEQAGRTAWLASYAKHLTDNGLYADWKSIDWEKEANQPNKDAAAYAGLVTSKQLNVNASNANSEVVSSPSAMNGILKSTYGLFGMFGFNKSVGQLNNLSVLFGGSTSLKYDESGNVVGTEKVSKEQRREEISNTMRSLVGGVMEEEVAGKG